MGDIEEVPGGRFIRRLRPAGVVPVAVSRPDELATARAVLGAPAVDWAVQVAAKSFAAVLAGPRGPAVDPVAERVHRAIERASLDLLRHLGGHSPDPGLSADQRVIVRTSTRQHVPVSWVTRGLRSLQREWTSALAAEVERYRPAAERPALRELLMAVVPGFVDETIDAVVAEHLSQREQLLAEETSDRRALVRAVLADEDADPGQVAETLGLHLDDHHLALVLWLDGKARRGFHMAVERLADRVSAALGCRSWLSLPSDDVTTWAWVSRPTTFPDDAVDRLPALAAGTGDVRLRIAVGRPAPGRDGFRTSHETARDAQRVSLMTPGAPALTAYRDVSMAGLLTVDPGRARRFVLEELGPLAAAGADLADLRRTALAHLDGGGVIGATARSLHVHRNTVVYRLRRIERLLGRPLDARLLNVHAAVMLAVRHGGALLGPGELRP